MLKQVEDGPAIVACNTCRHSADEREDDTGMRGGAQMAAALRSVQGFWRSLCSLDRMSLERHAKVFADSAEDCRKIVHTRIALFRKHPVQAFARTVGLGRQFLETDRGIDEIAQDQPRHVRLAIEERGCGLVQHGLGEGGIARSAFPHRFLEIAGQNHLVTFCLS